MKIIMVKNNKKKNKINNELFQWGIYIFTYTLVLILSSVLFKGIYIRNIFYGFIATILIVLLNKTIKPYLILISLPLIGVTLGLFYFVINVVILYLIDIVLGNNFVLSGFFSVFVISIFISFCNAMIDAFVIRPIIDKRGI